MDKDQVREVILIARDIEMAVRIQEQVSTGIERGLVDFADGDKISVPVPPAVGMQLDNKIGQLLDLLQAKVAALRK